MTIWTYRDSAMEGSVPLGWDGPCFFCRADMDELRSTRREGVNESWARADVFGCPRCGWWRASENSVTRMYRGHGYAVRIERRAAAGSLLELDVSDQAAPIQAIRETLMIAPHKLGVIHHNRFEQVVADVYRDLGYEARATAQSGDDGIDVILEGDGVRIGIQVKRYQGAIQVEQIRALAGALVLNGMTRGVFVTTSGFTTGAPRTVAGYARAGYQIELVDGTRFLEQLEIAQREMYRDREELVASIARDDLVLIGIDHAWEPKESGEWPRF
ncbi:MAG: restriction system protein [Pseudonocardiales bacterium]|jgi:hypothetical protein|nr:restriction system protein [Pseudonocardiales bacterium]